MKKLFLKIILSFLFVQFTFAELSLLNKPLNSKFYFIDEPVNCREEPTTSSKSLGKFYVGDCVKIVDYSSKFETFDGIEACWIKVECVNRNLSGYVFPGYLAETGFKAKLGSSFGDNRDYFIGSRRHVAKIFYEASFFRDVYIFSPEKKRILFSDENIGYSHIFFYVSKDKKKTIVAVSDMYAHVPLPGEDDIPEGFESEFIFDIYELTSKNLNYIESLTNPKMDSYCVFDKSIIKTYLGDCDYDVF